MASVRVAPSVSDAVFVANPARPAPVAERAATVLVPAYNEEQNIRALLHRLASETGVNGWVIDDIIVIASGCTDNTVARAEAARSEGLPITIIEQERREGKASAINMGLAAAQHDLIVLVSGDVLPARGAVPALLTRLEDTSVGVVGGRPVPMNDETTFTGYATHLMWRLHHAVSAATPDNPKCGELIVFRKRLGRRWIVPAIPVESAVDEVSVQSLVVAAGLRSAYVPDAIVNNWGPSTLRDWLRQRRRINSGHIIARRQGYKPSTMRTGMVLRSMWGDTAARKRPHWMLAVIAIEVTARVFGHRDVKRRREHAVWKVAETTKRSIGEEVV